MRVPVEPSAGRRLCIARVSLFDSSRWMLQGEAVRKRLRVLWSLESMKHRLMASMFFLPSEATRLGYMWRSF